MPQSDAPDDLTLDRRTRPQPDPTLDADGETITHDRPQAAALPLPVVLPEVYTVVSELGRGGMGRVVLARDRRLDRTVALKELLPGAADAARRFEREAMTTARLQHPSIVSVYEAGRWPGGEPFYAMRVVSGQPLEAALHACQSLGDRLALLPSVLAIADAMAYAHQQGIVHRDLKPANVILGAFGETVVVDWGLARDLRASNHADAASEDHAAPDQALTMAGSVVGTPSYMAPEQAHGLPVDERADVYALGAILYQLLSGQKAYSGRSSIDVLNQVLAGPPRDLAALVPEAPADLLAVVRKAMARDAAERYRDAGEVADDLRRFQTGQLVGAHTYSVRELARRFVRRHRVPLTVAAGAALILATIGILGVQRIRAERTAAEEGRAAAEKARAETAARNDQLVLSHARTFLDRDPTQALAWLKTYSRDGASSGALRTIAADAIRRGVAHRVLRYPAPVNAVRFLGEGQVASASEDGKIRFFDMKTGASREWSSPEAAPLYVLETLSASRVVVGGKDGGVHTWDVRDGTSKLLTRHPGEVWSVASSAAGRVASTSEGVLRVTDDGSATLVREWSVDKRHGAWALLSGDGRWVAHCTWEKVRLLEVDGVGSRVFDPGRCASFSQDSSLFGVVETRRGGTSHLRVVDLAGGPDRERSAEQVEYVAGALTSSTQAVAASGTGRIHLLDLATRSSQVVAQDAGKVQLIWASTGGRRLATLDEDREDLRIWETSSAVGVSGTPSYKPAIHRMLRGHANAITDAAFSADGRWLATAGEDATVRIWDLDDGLPQIRQAGIALFAGAELDPGRGRIAIAECPWEIGTTWIDVPVPCPVELWDIASGRRRLLAPAPLLDLRTPRNQRPVVWSADGRWLAIAAQDGAVWLWDTTGAGAGLRRARHTGPVSAIESGTSGSLLVTGGSDGQVLLWDRSGAPRPLRAAGEGAVRHVAPAPDSRSLAAAIADGTVLRFDIATGTHQTMRGPGSPLNHLAWSADGGMLAGAAEDGTVLLWESGHALRVFRGMHGSVRKVAFSPDGTAIAACGADPVVRLWDLATGRERRLVGHGSYVRDVAFSPDGTRLATVSSSDRTARIWDIATGESRVLPHDGLHNVVRAQFTGDGRALMTAAWDGVRVWRDDLPADGAGVLAWLASRPGLAVEGDAAAAPAY